MRHRGRPGGRPPAPSAWRPRCGRGRLSSADPSAPLLASAAAAAACRPAPPSRRARCRCSERLVELGRDDEDLVRLALRELGQHLQVLVGEQPLGRARRRGSPGRRSRSPSPRPRRAGSPPALRPRREHRRLLLALGGEDLRLLDALGGEDRARRSRSARICFSIASWIRARRVDRLELDAVDADAPAARRLVEHDAQLGVDVVARWSASPRASGRR